MALLVSWAAACEDDGKGGSSMRAGSSTTTPPAQDKDAAFADCGSGTKWSELYRDIFGDTKKPGSCTFLSSCHGPGGDGAKNGSGIECFDEKGCRASIIERLSITPSDFATPERSNLIGVLRRPNGSGGISGIMPKAPSDYVFPQSCIDRVAGWLEGGAKDD